MITLVLLCAISLLNQGLILTFVTVYMTLVVSITVVCMNLPLELQSERLKSVPIFRKLGVNIIPFNLMFIGPCIIVLVEE